MTNLVEEVVIMRYCGVVTDRSWYEAMDEYDDLYIDTNEGETLYRSRIYSDEVIVSDWIVRSEKVNPFYQKT